MRVIGDIKILVADDYESMRLLIFLVLSKMRHDVDTVGNGLVDGIGDGVKLLRYESKMRRGRLSY